MIIQFAVQYLLNSTQYDFFFYPISFSLSFQGFSIVLETVWNSLHSGRNLQAAGDWTLQLLIWCDWNMLWFILQVGPALPENISGWSQKRKEGKALSRRGALTSIHLINKTQRERDRKRGKDRQKRIWLKRSTEDHEDGVPGESKRERNSINQTNQSCLFVCLIPSQSRPRTCQVCAPDALAPDCNTLTYTR